MLVISGGIFAIFLKSPIGIKVYVALYTIGSSALIVLATFELIAEVNQLNYRKRDCAAGKFCRTDHAVFGITLAAVFIVLATLFTAVLCRFAYKFHKRYNDSVKACTRGCAYDPSFRHWVFKTRG
jgi:hypothetical protein